MTIDGTIDKDTNNSVLAKHEANLARQTAGEVSRYAGAPITPAVRGAFLLRSIWRRRVFILMLTALALLPAVVYVHLATPLYTSTSNLLLSRTTATDRTGPKQPQDSLSKEDIAEQRDVIISTPVLAAALAAPGVRDCDPLRNHHDLIEFLKHALKIQTGNGSELSISIASSDPEAATHIVTAVVGAYSQFLSSFRRNGNTDLTNSLRVEKAADQAELATKSADLLHFGEEHHVGAGADVAASGAAELAKLAQSVSQAHLDAVAAKAASDALGRALADNPQRAQNLKQFEQSSPASGRANSDDEELIRSELLILKARQAEMQQKLMPGHPSLVKIQQQIDDLNLQDDAAIQRRPVLAAQHEADLQHAYEDQQKRILDQIAQQAEYDRRNGDVTALQKTIDGLEQRIRGLVVADNSDAPTVSVLDPAKASPTPTSPNRQRILLLTGIAGFVLSSLLACWLERGRTGGIRLDRLGVNLPVLAELPTLPTDFGPIGRGERALLDGEPALEEIFKGLNAVVQGAKNRGRGVVVLITSPSRADGKSTLASNLAVSLAQTHKRVLLVDADLRWQSQSKIFGIGNATGLGMLLEADVSIPITAIHHTGTPSLDVIPSGPPLTRNPSELLNSQRFMDLVGDLAERYDYVLLDSPPTVTFTDARTISASSDITLMVVRTNQLNRRLFQIACDGLTTVGANLCGLILNSGQDQERSNRILESTTRESRQTERVLT